MDISAPALAALYNAVKLNFNEGRNSYDAKWEKIATLVNSHSGPGRLRLAG